MRQPCLIKKNTLELRKKLEEIGLEIMNSGNTTLDCHNYDGKGHHKTIEEGRAIITYFADYYGVIYDIDTVAKHDRIDCGTNEELFLAIVALRDNTDMNQWFVIDTNLTSISEPNKITTTKGTFVKCLRRKWFVDYDEDGNPSKFSSRNTPAHKATIEELMNHFNNNMQ